MARSMSRLGHRALLAGLLVGPLAFFALLGLARVGGQVVRPGPFGSDWALPCQECASLRHVLNSLMHVQWFAASICVVAALLGTARRFNWVRWGRCDSSGALCGLRLSVLPATSRSAGGSATPLAAPSPPTHPVPEPLCGGVGGVRVRDGGRGRGVGGRTATFRRPQLWRRGGL